MKKITVYSKDYCPYCKAAKALLREKGLDFEEVEVGYDPYLFEEMVAKSQRRTVPQVYFGDEHIGGFTDLESYLSNWAQLEWLEECA